MPSKPPPTYGTIARKLTQLGFARQPTTGKHVYYRHPNGAVILLPNRTHTARVGRLHLAMIARVLEDYQLVGKNGQPVG